MGTPLVRKITAKRSQRSLLRVEGLPALAQRAKAVGFYGVEAISQPFEFSLELELPEALGAKADAIAAACMGRALGIELAAAGASRWFHGEVAGVHLDECGGSDDAPRLVLDLRPQFAALAQTRDTRLFANRTAQQIVDAVLAAHGLSGKFAWRLAPGHRFAVRAHCWQYRETDLYFVSRLLAEEGFRYWFAFSRTGHHLIISNGPQEVAAYEKPLPLGAADPELDDGRPRVSFIRRSWRSASASCIVRGRSPLEPQTVVEGRSADASDRMPPGASGTLYDTDAAVHEIAACRSEARRQRELAHATACTADGESNAAQMAAGQFVRIDTRKPKPGLGPLLPTGGTRYRLLSVAHEAVERTKRYRNCFAAVPDDAPFVSPTLHPPPACVGTTAAEVMSAPDEHGRFQLKFDLDRTGQISAAVPMAHPQEVFFLPRVGERVSVEFHRGNMERPLIRDRLPTAAIFPFDPKSNSHLGGITTPAHKLWFESGEARWALLEIAGRLRELVKGDRETIVEKDVIEKVLGAVNCTVEKSWAGKIGQQFGMQAKEVLFQAADRIVFSVGGSGIVIDSNGITVNGAPLLHLNPPGGAAGAAPPVPAPLPEAPKPQGIGTQKKKPATVAPAAAPHPEAAKLTPEQQAALAKLPPEKQAAVLDSLTPWFLKPGGSPPPMQVDRGPSFAVDRGNHYRPPGVTGYEPPRGLEVNPDPFNKPVLTLDEIGDLTAFVAGVPTAPGFPLQALQGCLTSTPPTTPAQGFGFVACNLLPNLTGDSKQPEPAVPSKKPK